MLIGTAEFMIGCDDDAVIAAYNAAFSAEMEDGMFVDDIRQCLSDIREICDGIEPNWDTVVFATMVPVDEGSMVPDIYAMHASRIAEIPSFMRKNPMLSQNDEPCEYTGSLPSFPLLLSNVADLANTVTYIPDDISGYDAITMAAMVYEITMLRGDVAKSEAAKEEITQAFSEAAGQKASGLEIDEAVFVLTEEKRHTNMPTWLQKKRYNARLEMYERIYADVTPVFKTRKRES